MTESFPLLWRHHVLSDGELNVLEDILTEAPDQDDELYNPETERDVSDKKGAADTTDNTTTYTSDNTDNTADTTDDTDNTTDRQYYYWYCWYYWQHYCWYWY